MDTGKLSKSKIVHILIARINISPVDYFHTIYKVYYSLQFVANTLIAALELDALSNSHPIEVDVGHPSEVDEIFDDISYNKVSPLSF